ncbi:MAG: hypothetical protein F4Y12_07440 [Acidimicrobiaceae bacterium]|nr:hypothetical protein [Acidimicrobiaceae bacterium]MYH76801.1 hypothetical protein [Acidimicrobiaceae bacterium]MYK77139.1 hypothetical protein [Acidimicrobiaceae bacterium]
MLLAAVIMALGALGVLALGTAALLDLGPFAPTDPAGLEVADKLGDCREARLDRGEGCDEGADVAAINLSLSGEDALVVELQLSETPSPGPSLAWTAEFYADAANGHTEGGVICRLSNVTDGGRAGPEVDSRALDPNTVPRQLVDDRACEGRLDGSVARFSIDVSGQPDDAQFRLIGLVRVEHPGDDTRPGSEDDFLVRASLADLRG